MTTTAVPGQRLGQYRNGTLIRRVLVLSTTGASVRVRALNGPLAGSEYDVDAKDLR